MAKLISLTVFIALVFSTTAMSSQMASRTSKLKQLIQSKAEAEDGNIGWWQPTSVSSTASSSASGSTSSASASASAHIGNLGDILQYIQNQTGSTNNETDCWVPPVCEEEEPQGEVPDDCEEEPSGEVPDDCEEEPSGEVPDDCEEEPTDDDCEEDGGSGGVPDNCNNGTDGGSGGVPDDNSTADCNCTDLQRQINETMAELTLTKARLGYLEIESDAKWQYLASKISEVEVQQDQLAFLQLQAAYLISGIQTNLTTIESGHIQSTLDYIQENGLMVSGRWRLGEEAGSNGNLVIRDEISTIVLGQDSRYVLSRGVARNI